MEWDAEILFVRDYVHEGKTHDRIVKLKTPEGFSFTPGQFVMIGHENVKLLNNPNALKWGSMSIASSPLERGFLELVISVGEPTGITHYTAYNLKVGDKLKTKGPFGKFVLKEDAPGFGFVGTGTGIAPLLSMMRTLVMKRVKKPMKFFFGFQFMEKYLYREELAEYAKLPNFELKVITSREKSPEGKQGYVTDLLKAYDFSKHSDMAFFLCGNPKAIDDVIAALKAKGFPDERINREKW